MKVRGLQAVDRRTTAARALVAWRADLLGALGGEEAASPQERVLVDLVVRTKLYVDSIDAWIMEQSALVQVKRKSVLPVLRERQVLADSLARLLGQLGLERRVKQVPNLRAYLAARSPAETPVNLDCESRAMPTSAVVSPEGEG